jgi:phosphoglycolate phosphatase-like HAD superfamily hydrolase
MAGSGVALFDVDETLVHTGGSGARSWRYAFDKLYGIPADIGAHTSAGETDPVVGRKTFEAVLGREPTRTEMARIYALYLLHLSEDIWRSKAYRVLDGAEETLQRLSDDGVVLGIVSGAMEGAARAKLSRADLNRFFIFGGYGSDSPDRGELIRIAIDRASQLHDESLEPADVLVVGDTPHDVEATTAAGAVSVAVASGKYSVEELRAAGADHVMRSLKDPFPTSLEAYSKSDEY